MADFKSRREPGRSRSEYIEQYQKDLAELYGYIPDLVEMFVDHFGPSEALEFMEASDKARPLVIRVNTLKARRKDLAASLLKRGVNLDPLASWSKVGLKVYDSPIPIGATPEYLAGKVTWNLFLSFITCPTEHNILSQWDVLFQWVQYKRMYNCSLCCLILAYAMLLGHYMLQSASSMCPVLSLAPSLKDRVLDMSSAPGGKTSYIAQLMKNTGTIVANDLRPDRQKATMGNLARLGTSVHAAHFLLFLFMFQTCFILDWSFEPRVHLLLYTWNRCTKYYSLSSWWKKAGCKNEKLLR